MLGSISPPSIISSTYSHQAIGGLDEAQTSTVSGSSQTSGHNNNLEITSEEPTRTQKDSVQISAEAREIATLVARDHEVRAHEAAHAAVGGQYAGSPSLTYTKGPDGRSYATGGEVSISVSAVGGDPLATLQKAETIRAAALAPAQPSAQDMRVASKAAAMASQARAELAAEVSPEHGGLSDADEDESGESTSDVDFPKH